jgi:hypothetical protein
MAFSIALDHRLGAKIRRVATSSDGAGSTSLFGGTTGGSRFCSRRVDRFLVAVQPAGQRQVVEFPMDLTRELAAPFGTVERGQSSATGQAELA